MKKNTSLIRLSLMILWMLPLQCGAASLVSVPDVRQGDFFELLIPKHDFGYIEANLEGAPIRFFEVERTPAFDEAISRAEFLKLLFDNGEFEDVKLHAAAKFPDIVGSRYEDEIKKASALDIIHGFHDGTFRPHEPISRGQVAKILMNALNPEEFLTGNYNFWDLPRNHVFYDFMNRAIRAGIFKGYPDGKIRPDRPINFSEAEIVLKRVLAEPEIKVIGNRGYYRAFIGIHRSSALGPKPLKLNLRDQTGTFHHIAKDVDVLQRRFPVKSFSLAADKTKLFSKKLQDLTWKMVNDSKKETSDRALWDGEFIKPAEGIRTLGFGDILYINGKFSGSHFGIDWANVQGTPILAANSGKVTLADFTPSFGNTIVIDHGHNVFTMYLHLFELGVSAGDLVQKGDQIGLMGTTGISTGSHLHFTHFVDDIVVDSQPWMERVY